MCFCKGKCKCSIPTATNIFYFEFKIKEKYSIQKLGVPMKQLHSYDSGGPYAGFKGAINFYQEIDRLVNSKVWSYMKAPWQTNPELSAAYVWE